MPNGDGTYFLVVNKSIRDAAGVSSGDSVHVVMEQDTCHPYFSVMGEKHMFLWYT
ncbi:DUF1905 domain-containing protein [Candidatus Formimonas warabiya]